MAIPFANEYHLRTVADTAAKACIFDYKPSTKVLITPDNKDFFYVCASHLQDHGFATPKVDPKAEAERLEREALQNEIEAVKKEWEEKQKKKKKSDKKDDKKQEADAEKEKDNKIKELEQKAEQKTENGPRIFVLNKDIYQMRLKRVRDIEVARRHQARMNNPTLFPDAPKGDLV